MKIRTNGLSLVLFNSYSYQACFCNESRTNIGILTVWQCLLLTSSVCTLLFYLSAIFTSARTSVQKTTHTSLRSMQPQNHELISDSSGQSQNRICAAYGTGSLVFTAHLRRPRQLTTRIRASTVYCIRKSIRFGSAKHQRARICVNCTSGYSRQQCVTQ